MSAGEDVKLAREYIEGRKQLPQDFKQINPHFDDEEAYQFLHNALTPDEGKRIENAIRQLFANDTGGYLCW